MKKTLTILFTLGSSLILADVIGFWHMLIVFLFVGIIPGTNLTISADAMMVFYSIAAGLLITRSFILPSIKATYSDTSNSKPKTNKLVRA